jgi:D-alanyl-lipoteichoic acid acyltransferase DltB (MBOAT superfamily)
MIVGFFKKICVADMISIYVNAIYNNAEEATALGIIVATALFAVQIYCDFSGYTDIAIGCSRIMGIKLMKNFDHPYMATSIKEFWARWHISLSSWFKDYLYIPLGGNRCSKARHLFNIMVVFLVSGLWHGAAWTFVIWGAIHGIYQIVGTLTWKKRNALLKSVGLSEKSVGIVWLRRFNTFVLACFAWLFFRANSFSDALTLLKKLFATGWSYSFSEVLAGLELDLAAILMTVLSILTLIAIDRLVTYEGDGDGSNAIIRNGSFIYYVWMVFFTWAVLLSKDMTSTFIYFQF